LSTVIPAQAGPGDPDGNGAVDIVDAFVVAQYYIGLELPGFDRDAGDVNCTGSIDIIDAFLIAKYYVGLISKFTDCRPTPAPTPVSPDDEYLMLIERWAKEKGINLTGYNKVKIESESAEYILPGYTFFILYLIQYPVAYWPPDEQLDAVIRIVE
jgi:hypothetical protein